MSTFCFSFFSFTYIKKCYIMLLEDYISYQMESFLNIFSFVRGIFNFAN